MEDAQQRRARLAALREQAQSGAEPQPEEPVLKFRNYAVKDKKIDHVTIEAAQAPEFVDPVAEPSVIQEVQGEVRSPLVALHVK
jgi:coiled-coil domain-containing protein 12